MDGCQMGGRRGGDHVPARHRRDGTMRPAITLVSVSAAVYAGSASYESRVPSRRSMEVIV